MFHTKILNKKKQLKFPKTTLNVKVKVLFFLLPSEKITVNQLRGLAKGLLLGGCFLQSTSEGLSREC